MGGTDSSRADGQARSRRIRIRRLRADEWRELRAFCLRAPASDPAAFGQRLAEAQPDDAWRELAAAGAAGVARATSVAKFDGPVGRHGESGGSRRRQVEVRGLWTAPEARGRGVGGGLIEGCRAWAREKKAARILLWVNAANDSARRLYERTGYAALGDPQQGTRDPSRWFLRMGRDV